MINFYRKKKKIVLKLMLLEQCKTFNKGLSNNLIKNH